MKRVDARREKLSQVVHTLEESGQFPSRQLVIKEMQELGYEDYDLQRLNSDRRGGGSNFVRDLAAKTYSAYVEQCYDTLDVVEQSAERLAGGQWQQLNVKKRKWEDDDGNLHEVTEESTTDITPKIQLEALKLMQKSSELKMRIVSGDNIHISAAMLAEKFKRLNGENARLKKLVGDTEVADL